MSYLVGNNILISEQNNINNFGHFTIDSYTVKAGGNYTLVLTPIFGNGNFDTSKFYDFAVFTLTSQGVPTFNSNIFSSLRRQSIFKLTNTWQYNF